MPIYRNNITKLMTITVPILLLICLTTTTLPLMMAAAETFYITNSSYYCSNCFITDSQIYNFNVTKMVESAESEFLSSVEVDIRQFAISGKGTLTIRAESPPSNTSIPFNFQLLNGSSSFLDGDLVMPINHRQVTFVGSYFPRGSSIVIKGCTWVWRVPSLSSTTSSMAVLSFTSTSWVGTTLSISGNTAAITTGADTQTSFVRNLGALQFQNGSTFSITSNVLTSETKEGPDFSLLRVGTAPLFIGENSTVVITSNTLSLTSTSTLESSGVVGYAYFIVLYNGLNIEGNYASLLVIGNTFSSTITNQSKMIVTFLGISTTCVMSSSSSSSTLAPATARIESNTMITQTVSLALVTKVEESSVQFIRFSYLSANLTEALFMVDGNQLISSRGSKDVPVNATNGTFSLETTFMSFGSSTNNIWDVESASEVHIVNNIFTSSSDILERIPVLDIFALLSIPITLSGGSVFNISTNTVSHPINTLKLSPIKVYFIVGQYTALQWRITTSSTMSIAGNSISSNTFVSDGESQTFGLIYSYNIGSGIQCINVSGGSTFQVLGNTVSFMATQSTMDKSVEQYGISWSGVAQLEDESFMLIVNNTFNFSSRQVGIPDYVYDITIPTMALWSQRSHSTTYLSNRSKWLIEGNQVTMYSDASHNVAFIKMNHGSNPMFLSSGSSFLISRNSWNVYSTYTVTAYFFASGILIEEYPTSFRVTDGSTFAINGNNASVLLTQSSMVCYFVSLNAAYGTIEASGSSTLQLNQNVFDLGVLDLTLPKTFLVFYISGTTLFESGALLQVQDNTATSNITSENGLGFDFIHIDLPTINPPKYSTWSNFSFEVSYNTMITFFNQSKVESSNCQTSFMTLNGDSWALTGGTSILLHNNTVTSTHISDDRFVSMYFSTFTVNNFEVSEISSIVVDSNVVALGGEGLYAGANFYRISGSSTFHESAGSLYVTNNIITLDFTSNSPTGTSGGVLVSMGTSHMAGNNSGIYISSNTGLIQGNEGSSVQATLAAFASGLNITQGAMASFSNNTFDLMGSSESGTVDTRGIEVYPLTTSQDSTFSVVGNTINFTVVCRAAVARIYLLYVPVTASTSILGRDAILQVVSNNGSIDAKGSSGVQALMLAFDKDIAVADGGSVLVSGNTFVVMGSSESGMVLISCVRVSSLSISGQDSTFSTTGNKFNFTVSRAESVGFHLVSISTSLATISGPNANFHVTSNSGSVEAVGMDFVQLKILNCESGLDIAQGAMASFSNNTFDLMGSSHNGSVTTSGAYIAPLRVYDSGSALVVLGNTFNFTVKNGKITNVYLVRISSYFYIDNSASFHTVSNTVRVSSTNVSKTSDRLVDVDAFLSDNSATFSVTNNYYAVHAVSRGEGAVSSTCVRLASISYLSKTSIAISDNTHIVDSLYSPTYQTSCTFILVAVADSTVPRQLVITVSNNHMLYEGGGAVGVPGASSVAFFQLFGIPQLVTVNISVLNNTVHGSEKTGHNVEFDMVWLGVTSGDIQIYVTAIQVADNLVTFAGWGVDIVSFKFALVRLSASIFYVATSSNILITRNTIRLDNTVISGPVSLYFMLKTGLLGLQTAPMTATISNNVVTVSNSSWTDGTASLITTDGLSIINGAIFSVFANTMTLDFISTNKLSLSVIDVNAYLAVSDSSALVLTSNQLTVDVEQGASIALYLVNIFTASTASFSLRRSATLEVKDCDLTAREGSVGSVAIRGVYVGSDLLIDDNSTVRVYNTRIYTRHVAQGSFSSALMWLVHLSLFKLDVSNSSRGLSIETSTATIVAAPESGSPIRFMEAGILKMEKLFATTVNISQSKVLLSSNSVNVTGQYAISELIAHVLYMTATIGDLYIEGNSEMTFQSNVILVNTESAADIEISLMAVSNLHISYSSVVSLLDQSVMGVCSFTDISTVYGVHSEGDVTLSAQSSLLVDGTTIQLELTISDSDEVMVVKSTSFQLGSNGDSSKFEISNGRINVSTNSTSVNVGAFFTDSLAIVGYTTFRMTGIASETSSEELTSYLFNVYKSAAVSWGSNLIISNNTATHFMTDRTEADQAWYVGLVRFEERLAIATGGVVLIEGNAFRLIPIDSSGSSDEYPVAIIVAMIGVDSDAFDCGGSSSFTIRNNTMVADVSKTTTTLAELSFLLFEQFTLSMSCSVTVDLNNVTMSTANTNITNSLSSTTFINFPLAGNGILITSEGQLIIETNTVSISATTTPDTAIFAIAITFVNIMSIATLTRGGGITIASNVFTANVSAAASVTGIAATSLICNVSASTASVVAPPLQILGNMLSFTVSGVGGVQSLAMAGINVGSLVIDSVNTASPNSSAEVVRIVSNTIVMSDRQTTTASFFPRYRMVGMMLNTTYIVPSATPPSAPSASLFHQASAPLQLTHNNINIQSQVGFSHSSPGLSCNVADPTAQQCTLMYLPESGLFTYTVPPSSTVLYLGLRATTSSSSPIGDDDLWVPPYFVDAVDNTMYVLSSTSTFDNSTGYWVQWKSKVPAASGNTPTIRIRGSLVGVVPSSSSSSSTVDIVGPSIQQPHVGIASHDDGPSTVTIEACRNAQLEPVRSGLVVGATPLFWSSGLVEMCTATKSIDATPTSTLPIPTPSPTPPSTTSSLTRNNTFTKDDSNHDNTATPSATTSITTPSPPRLSTSTSSLPLNVSRTSTPHQHLLPPQNLSTTLTNDGVVLPPVDPSTTHSQSLCAYSNTTPLPSCAILTAATIQQEDIPTSWVGELDGPELGTCPTSSSSSPSPPPTKVSVPYSKWSSGDAFKVYIRVAPSISLAVIEQEYTTTTTTGSGNNVVVMNRMESGLQFGVVSSRPSMGQMGSSIYRASVVVLEVGYAGQAYLSGISLVLSVPQSLLFNCPVVVISSTTTSGVSTATNTTSSSTSSSTSEEEVPPLLLPVVLQVHLEAAPDPVVDVTPVVDTGSAISAISGMPTAVVKAGLATSLANMMRCTEFDPLSELGFVNNPSSWRVGTEVLAYHRGSVLFALLVILSAAVITFLFLVYFRFSHHANTWPEAWAMARMPSFVLVVVLVCGEVCMGSITVLLFYQRDTEEYDIPTNELITDRVLAILVGAILWVYLGYYAYTCTRGMYVELVPVHIIPPTLLSAKIHPSSREDPDGAPNGEDDGDSSSDSSDNDGGVKLRKKTKRVAVGRDGSSKPVRLWKYLMEPTHHPVVRRDLLRPPTTSSGSSRGSSSGGLLVVPVDVEMGLVDTSDVDDEDTELQAREEALRRLTTQAKFHEADMWLQHNYYFVVDRRWVAFGAFEGLVGAGIDMLEGVPITERGIWRCLAAPLTMLVLLLLLFILILWKRPFAVRLQQWANFCIVALLIVANVLICANIVSTREDIEDATSIVLLIVSILISILGLFDMLLWLLTFSEKLRVFLHLEQRSLGASRAAMRADFKEWEGNNRDDWAVRNPHAAKELHQRSTNPTNSKRPVRRSSSPHANATDEQINFEELARQVLIYRLHKSRRSQAFTPNLKDGDDDAYL